jgi:molecular chaperone Hsp33
MDYLIKSLALGGRVRVFVANTTSIINEAIETHDLWPSAASVFGKALTVALMMGAALKGDETLTVKIDGNGPIGNILVDSNANGVVRGYVKNPHVHFSRSNNLDDVTTLGYNGFINVLKDLKMKDFYSSTVPLQTGDLAKDFAYYFTTSEQSPTLLCLGTNMLEDNTASINGGILIQLMPDATEDDILYLESKTSIISKFSELLNEHKNLEDVLKLVFENDYVILDKMDLKYFCDCTKDKFAKGIASLGINEVDDIITTDGEAEVICHYCNERYHFSKEDLERIKEGIKK